MGRFFDEIKNRRVRKWLAAYLSVAVTVIGVVNVLSNRYNLSSKLFDTLLVTLSFGLLSILLISWFHGEPGKQKFGFLEIGLHSVVILAASVALYFVISSNPIQILPENTKTIAVLPFTDMNADKQDDFFSDGLTDDILTQLSKISDLQVISRTSVMKYKNTKLSIREIAKDLHVGSILEGSVRRVGNRVRITGQLINANKDEHIWANTYDRDLKNIFSIQSEIAQKIADELAAKLSPMEKKLIDVKPTENIDAYTLYLKGKHFYYNYNKVDNEKAVALFKKALKIDSNYALALAGLADTYNQRVTKYWQSDDWFDSAIVLSKKALEINPNLPEAYKSLASAYDGMGKKDLALVNYKSAIRLNPNYTQAIMNLGQIKLFSGKYDDAFYWIRKANILAPDNILGIISRSYIYKYLRCDSLAIKWAKKAVDLDPQNKYVLSNIGEAYLSSGDYRKANKYFKRSIAVDTNWIMGWFLGTRIETALGNYKLAKEYSDKYMEIANVKPEYFYAYFLMKLNQSDSAMKILKREKQSYVEYIKENPDATNLDFIALAEIYAIFNERDNAFKTWSEAINKGYTDISRTVYYPFLDTLKSDPRYNLLQERMKNKIDSMKNIIKEKFPTYKICR